MNFAIFSSLYLLWMFLSQCADGSVTISSSAATVPEGSPLTLTCTYIGIDHLYLIKWINNGNNSTQKYVIPINQPEPCSIFGKPGLNESLFTYTCLTLTINVTRDNQNDNFTCQANLNLKSGNSVIVSVSVPISTVVLTSPTNASATVNAGSSKKFTCHTSGGLPQPTVEWYKTSSSSCTRNGVKLINSISSSPSEINGLIQVESSLLFTASSSDDSLWICCAASNINSEWKLSGTKLLDVRYPPPNPPVIDDFNTITDYQMIENSPERLTCRSTGGNPLASLAWSCYNGTESNPIISGDSVSRSVQFTARRNQDNSCTCTATHEAGPLQQAILDVNIMYPPSIPEFKLNGTPVSIVISIIKDSAQTVTCHSLGKPNPSTNDFTWTKGSVVVSSNSVLSWTGGIKIQDGGSYKCIVTTTMTPSDTSKTPVTTEVSSDVTMNVLYGPSTPEIRMNTLSGDVIMDQITVVTNRQFDLACKSTAHPTANYSWTGDSRTDHTQILQDIITTKTNTSRTCTAHNVLKPSVGSKQTRSSSASIAVLINYPPESVTIRHTTENGNMVLSNYNIMERANLKLFCDSQSNPSSAFSWTGSNILQNESVLLRNNISRSEKGHLSCTARNTMTHMDQLVEGLSSANITLNILYSPRLHQLSRHNALEGKNLTLKCEYEPGYPTETTVVITRLNDRITWTEITHFIPSLKRSDAGIYSCTIRNIMKPTGQQNEIVGEDTGIFEINVWYKSSVSKFGLTSHPDAVNVTVDENAALNFFCEVDSNPNSTIIFGRSDRLQDNVVLNRTDGFLHLAFDVQQAGCLDTASYYCLGYNNYTDIETAPRKQMDVYVRCSPRASGGQQKINVTGVIDGNATFSFDVVAYPVPNEEGYVWHKWNGTTYSKVHNSDKYTINNAGVLTTFTINAIEQEDFSTYLLTVSNGISPDLNKIFNLKPQDVPQCPTDVTFIATTSSSATVEWTSRFNGGLTQTFFILYKANENSEYLVHTEDELDQKIQYETAIKGLKDGTTYDVIIFSRNEKGNCKQNTSLQFETKLLVDSPPPSNAALIRGLAGGISSVCVAIVVVVVVVLVLRKRMSYKKGESRQALTKGQKLRTLNAVEEDADDLPDEVENPMYESSQPAAMKQDSPDVLYALPKKKGGDIYAVVDKKNKRPTKSQGTKKQKNDAHDNAGFDIYENNQSPQHPAKKNVNHDGLVYADIVFANPPKGQKRLVIHGIDDMTVYADVDLTKKVDPLPDSDGEDGGKKEPGKK
ncbi:hemicentin-1-like isoform X2 [Mya arenaria]|uniref:hemicentin-1-like isoform X2 n=1 Tax=Mya arenaria TaxID=6604 RepID=UPI0022E94DE4|nr:hemicentin-1-like isoform X2 [Mya arenaria]